MTVGFDPNRVLAPARPGLAAAMRVVCGEDAATVARWVREVGVRFRFAAAERLDGDVVDPRAAWEALEARGVLPAGTVGEPARLFVHESQTYGLPDGRPRTIHRAELAPAAVADAVALASCWAAVRTAEALAGEAVARLARFGAPPVPPRIAWRLVDRRSFAPEWWGYTEPRPEWVDRLAATTPDWAAWRAAIERSLGVRVGALTPGESTAWWTAAHAAAWDEAGDGPPNPWAPLRDIWRLGLAFDAVDADAIVLACPALPAGPA